MTWRRDEALDPMVEPVPVRNIGAGFAIGLGLMGCLAAATLLWLALDFAPSSPEPESFRSMLREPPAGHLPRTAFDYRQQPNFFVARWAHQAVLWLPGNDFGTPFSLVTIWLLAAAIGAVSLRFLRSHLGGHALPKAALWCGAGLLGLYAFRPEFGTTWLVTERYRVFLPVLWLVTGIWALSATCSHHPRAGERLAAGLGVLGAFTSAVGCLVWIVLLPVAWCSRRSAGRGAARRSALTVAVFGGCAMWFALDERPKTPEIPPGPYGVESAWEQPAEYGIQVAYRLGLALPDFLPTELMDRTVAGAVFGLGWLVAVFRAICQAVRRSARRTSLALGDPCLALWTFGILATVVEATIHFPSVTLFTDELLWPVAMGWLACLGFWARRGGRWPARLAIVIALLVIPAIQGWVLGLPRMQIESALLRQQTALAAVLPGHEITLPADAAPVLASAREQDALRSRGRLRATVDLRAAALAEAIATSEDLPAVGTLEVVDPRGNRLAGKVTDAQGFTVDAIVVTMTPPESPVRLVAVAVPSRIGTVSGTPLAWMTGVAPPTRAMGTRMRAFALSLSVERADRVPTLRPLSGSALAGTEGVFQRVGPGEDER